MRFAWLIARHLDGLLARRCYFRNLIHGLPGNRVIHQSGFRLLHALRVCGLGPERLAAGGDDRRLRRPTLPQSRLIGEPDDTEKGCEYDDGKDGKDRPAAKALVIIVVVIEIVIVGRGLVDPPLDIVF